MDSVKYFLLIFAMGALGCSPTYAATPILDDFGVTLLGATGVDIGGTLYDVEFLNGTCIELFDGCDSRSDDFSFPTEASALEAAQALIDQVFIDTADTMFDSMPLSINGCDTLVGCAFAIPFTFSVPTDTVVVALANNGAQSNSISAGVNAPRTLDSAADNDFLYARFSLSSATNTSTALFSSILPSSRSVRVGDMATAFATVINAGTDDAEGCSLMLASSEIDASFFYQATDPATNASVGDPDTPIDIPAGASQSFVFGVTPNTTLPPTEVELVYACDNAEPAASQVGLNTLLLSASDGAVADIVALTATIENDGIVRVDPAVGSGAFSVASINVGDGSDITVTADTGSAEIPVELSVCQTNPATGECINPTTPNTSPVSLVIGVDETPTFALFVFSSTEIPLAPGSSRVFVRFLDAAGQSRGATSVAVTTE